LRDELAKQKRIESASGVADLGLKRRIGEDIVTAENDRAELLLALSKKWKQSAKSCSDTQVSAAASCHHTPSVAGCAENELFITMQVGRDVLLGR
jgi:hypothetical protein